MKTTKQDLASVFAQIEKCAESLEGVAAGILHAVKANNAHTLDQFNDMVAEAYGRNGWSQRAGRPAVGSSEKPAPEAVKVYVSTVRAAYRMQLKVLTFDTMGALRIAIREKRAASAEAKPKSPELRGVQLTTETSLNGALWHDAMVVWDHLPAEQRELFETQVRRLLAKYTKQAPAELLQAANN